MIQAFRFAFKTRKLMWYQVSSLPSLFSQYFMPTILTTSLLLFAPAAIGEITITELSNLDKGGSFVDIDNDGDLDVFIRANEGTLKYYENVGTAITPHFKERTGSANPLSQVNVGKVNPQRTTRQRKPPLNILDVTDNLFLNTEQSAAELFLTVNDPKRVKSASVTVILPKNADVAPDEREVLANLPNLSCQFSGTIENVFKAPGAYQVHYFVQDSDTDEYLRASDSSLVHKSKEGNQAPAAFNLFSPYQGAVTKPFIQLNWETSLDPEGDMLTYSLLIAKDSDFNQLVYRQEQILHSQTQMRDSAFLTVEKKLQDKTTYYWKVEAVDDFGAITPSRHIFSFTTDQTNAGFNLEDANDDQSILGRPLLPDNLVVKVLGGEQRYQLTLNQTANEVFVLQNAIPTQQVHPYEATYDPVLKKLSIPGYGVLAVTETPKQLQLNVMDD